MLVDEAHAAHEHTWGLGKPYPFKFKAERNQSHSSTRNWGPCGLTKQHLLLEAGLAGRVRCHQYFNCDDATGCELSRVAVVSIT